jgi:hypothetical protein
MEISTNIPEIGSRLQIYLWTIFTSYFIVGLTAFGMVILQNLKMPVMDHHRLSEEKMNKGIAININSRHKMKTVNLNEIGESLTTIDQEFGKVQVPNDFLKGAILGRAETGGDGLYHHPDRRNAGLCRHFGS